MSKKRFTIYYTSDIHGSERCWRKFLNAGPFFNADVLVLGGDVTGKGIVPIVEGAGSTWACTFLGRNAVYSSEDEVAELEKDIRFNGMYPYRCTPEEVEALTWSPERQDQLFEILMEQTFCRWLEVADEKLSQSGIPCFVMPGNDDAWAIDRAFAGHEHVKNCDQAVVDLGNGYAMLSVGLSNATPWNSPREVSEEELGAIIDRLADDLSDPTTAIFNLHVPPFDSGLDTAPQLDSDLRPVRVGGQAMVVPVGSHAVRSAIERYQPLVGLHGHVHESKGKREIGRTLCVNPGSNYSTGQLDGVLITLEGTRVKTAQFVVG